MGMSENGVIFPIIAIMIINHWDPLGVGLHYFQTNPDVHPVTSCSRTPRIACADHCDKSSQGDVRHRTGRLKLVALSCTMFAISFSSFTKYRYMIYVTINIMYCIFYTLVSFKLRELSFAFTACFRASCASCKASVVSCTSFRKLVETKTWSEIHPHRRCWGVIFRMALVKGYGLPGGGVPFFGHCFW